MKCLLISSFFPPINGGSAVVYEMLCKYSPNNSVVVLAPKRHCATGQKLDWESYDKTADFRIHRLDLLRPEVVDSKSIFQSVLLLLFNDIPQRIKIFLYTAWLIKKYHIDAICIGELNSLSWLGQPLKRLFGIKVINYIHGEEVTVETNFRRYGNRRFDYLNRADLIIAVSNFTKQYLINRFNLSPEKIKLIPNGVDLNKFTPGDKPDYLLDRYKLQGKTILTSVGRLVPRKGIDQTIRALPKVIEKVPNVHFLVVGTGPYQDELMALTQSLALEEHVTFSGRIPEEELADHYRLCDLFLMPNRTMPDGDTEGFGLVFLEANACGKPVIGGKAGGAVEAVRSDYNGLSVDGFKDSEIADAIVKIITDSEFSNRLAENGLEFSKISSFENCAISFDKAVSALHL